MPYVPSKKIATAVKKAVATVKKRAYNRNRYHKKKTTKKVGFTMKPLTIGNIVREKRFTKMAYSTSFEVANTFANANTTVWFRANSINDPDYSNVGRNETPSGWTIASNLYNIYIVYKVDIIVKCYANDGNTYPTLCVITGNDALTNITTSEYSSQLRVRPGAVSCVVGSSTSSSSYKRMKKTFMIADLAGDKRAKVFSDGNYGAIMTADPVNTYYIGISQSPLPEGSGYLNKIVYEVDLVYHVMLKDQKNAITDD